MIAGEGVHFDAGDGKAEGKLRVTLRLKSLVEARAYLGRGEHIYCPNDPKKAM